MDEVDLPSLAGISVIEVEQPPETLLPGRSAEDRFGPSASINDGDPFALGQLGDGCEVARLEHALPAERACQRPAQRVIGAF